MGTQRPIQPETGRQNLAIELALDMTGQKIPKIVETAFLDGKSGGHRMPAAIDENAGLMRGNNGRPQTHARHRTSGPFADTVFKRDDTGRSIKPLAKAARHDAYYPRMPALPRHQDKRSVTTRLAFGLIESSLLHALLDLLPLSIVIIKALCDGAGFIRIACRKQSNTEPGIAYPAASIDPGTEHKPGVIGLKATIHSRHIGKRRYPWIATLGHDL